MYVDHCFVGCQCKLLQPELRADSRGPPGAQRNTSLCARPGGESRFASHVRFRPPDQIIAACRKAAKFFGSRPNFVLQVFKVPSRHLPRRAAGSLTHDDTHTHLQVLCSACAHRLGLRHAASPTTTNADGRTTRAACFVFLAVLQRRWGSSCRRPVVPAAYVRTRYAHLDRFTGRGGQARQAGGWAQETVGKGRALLQPYVLRWKETLPAVCDTVRRETCMSLSSPSEPRQGVTFPSRAPTTDPATNAVGAAPSQI